MEINDKFEVKGKGTLLVARLEDSDEMPCVGQYVNWCAQKWVITGVERTMMLLSTPIPSKNVALLVRPVD
jgi:translation elongation factor EF-Tu-like GTPase